jgi:hypothetical protein
MGNRRIRLPAAAKNGIAQHRRNRRKTRLAHAARRHFDLARRSIDAGDLKHPEVEFGARFLNGRLR